MMDLKTQKYDRQLRLWAATGQSALETASICLINASATGCEILKNLILPGVGNVTIIDDGVVNEDDVLSNFFLGADSTGQPKADAAAKLLQELNDDVRVSAVTKAPSSVIFNEVDFFEQFCMVIATNLHEKESLQLADTCHQLGLTLFLVQCKGLCGVFRLQAPEHPVIETHPQNAIDLRLGCPFPLLEDYTATFDLESMDQTDYGHVPYVVVLLKYVQQWKDEHGGQAPQTYDERSALKARIQAGMRTNDEENFEEAMANVWRLSADYGIPKTVRDILDDPLCTNVNAESDHFWVIARAIRDFVNHEGAGQLPLAGKLPDMKSNTTYYIGLQNTYRAKALEDMTAVIRRVQDLLVSFDASPQSIPTDMIESFCKNATHVRLSRFRTVHQERISSPNTKQIVESLRQEDNMFYYVVFIAADKFYTEYRRYPGTGPDTDMDVDLLRSLALEVMKSTMQIPSAEASTIACSDSMTKAVTNYVRFCDKETPNLAGLVGGLVAQEAIKMITRQYTPVNNTCVFNGLQSTSSVFEL